MDADHPAEEGLRAWKLRRHHLMSGRTVISVRGLGKRYQLGEKASSKATLRDSLAFATHRLFHRSSRDKRSASNFWALKDVSFDVAEGEVLGVIGANGAGKSTLLKILSQITEPTEGEVRVRGRVASLLEVGTGFHQELSGRENVFMNGAILGMSKAEIRRKFDEIVDFAGVEQFIDTPVKRYSSGMLVRLGFAVAAHLEPEILVIDEVLAVGDVDFQRRCLTKIDSVAQNGRTILFVSHNLAAVRSLSRSGLLLREGMIAARSGVDRVLDEYLASVNQANYSELDSRTERRGAGLVRLQKIEACSPPGDAGYLRSGARATITFHVSGRTEGLSCAFTVYDARGHAIAHFNSCWSGPSDIRDSRMGDRVQWQTEQLPLLPGRYRVNAALYSHNVLQDSVEGAATVPVIHGDFDGRLVPDNSRHGSVQFSHRWVKPI